MRRHSKHRFTALSAILLLFLLIVTGAVTGVHADDASEYEVKAAFLFNFAKFTEWPSGSFSGDQSPLTICVLGGDPFGKAFNAVRSKTVKNRPVSIREIADVEAAGGCHMLFIAASEQTRLDAILRSLGKQSVLTVSDMKKFAQSGGMISFVMVDDKVRFEINNGAADRAGLKISSQILKLARDVIE